MFASATRPGILFGSRSACRGWGKCGLCARCDLDDLKTLLPHLADVLIATQIERGGPAVSRGYGVVWRRWASAVWRRPAPGVRTAAASARREPARTTSFFARVMPV
jgi:hypothetical protein